MTSSTDGRIARSTAAARAVVDVAAVQARLRGTSRGCWSASFVLSLLAALPDALLALWLKLLGDGVLEHRRGLVRGRGDRRSASRPRRPGSCARSARACSAASATG